MSIITEKYYRGINLGGWLSQIKVKSENHYNTFITKNDIKVISKAGFDHVRVPFDYDLLEKDDCPYCYSKLGLGYIKQLLKWCEGYELNVILDLHKAPGYSFDTLGDNQLFIDEKLQDRAVGLWSFLAEEFREYDDCLVFELLNEIVEPDSSRWNLLARKMIKAIRKIDKNRYIIVGGNSYNSASELMNLDLPEDKRLIYTFHFYEPFFITHQKAYWSERMVEYNKNLEYPGKYIELEPFIKKHPEYDSMTHLLHEELDLVAMTKYLMPAIEFLEKKQVPLYCGEFGVIALASMETRENWHRDFMGLLSKYAIGSAVWSYKKMDFELFKDCKAISQELVEIVSSKSVL